MLFFFLLLLRWVYEPSQNSSSVGGNMDKRYLEALSILERPAISFISWGRHLPFTNTRTSACSLSLRKIHRSVLCCKGETGKGVNRCERSKDQVTSLPQKQSFVKRTGLFCFARQRRHTHAVLFQTPSLSSVPTASIFHMQQINFTFSADISSRDQPTSWYFLFSFYICRSILNKKLCVLQNMSASNTEEECDIFLPRIFWLTREKVYNLT